MVSIPNMGAAPSDDQRKQMEYDFDHLYGDHDAAIFYQESNNMRCCSADSISPLLHGI